MTIAADTGTIAGSLPGTAGSASANVVSVQGVAAMTQMFVGGAVATNVAIANANPVNLGAQAITSENTAVTATRMAQLVADKTGKLIILPYANPENIHTGVTAAMTGTTTTSLIGAVSSQKLYLMSISCSNSHATVGTFVNVQDGSGGTTLATLAAGINYGGESRSSSIPLAVSTAGNAIYVADVTTGANVICSGTAYSGV